MTKIEHIWTGLENDTPQQFGLLYKRYSADILPDVFVALKASGKFRCIAIKTSAKLPFDANYWNKLKDIKIELIPDERNSRNYFLLIILISKQHKDIFSIISEDLIFSIAQVVNEKDIVEKLLERLAKWQSLFEKVGQRGLTDEAQRGLFGEIYFLRILLTNNLDMNFCMKSWLGPDKAIQDFQGCNWAVEVKTTHGNNHQKIHINSERQLDDSNIENFFLFHLSLDVRIGNGESLNTLIDSVLEILNDHTLAYNLFRLKLLESGYYDVHKDIYNSHGYNVRQANLYKVAGNFPRITESQIPIGVGDVRYSIVLSESEEWRINYETLFEEIRQ